MTCVYDGPERKVLENNEILQQWVSNLCLSQAEISNDISENQRGLLGVHMVDLKMSADEIKEVFFY